MKIQIDIAHPAHIHYFRNLAKSLKSKGNECLFTIRKKGIIEELAKFYNLNYKIRCQEKYRNKINYAADSVKNIYKIAKLYKPDLFLDMGTIFASPVAKFSHKPYIAFDDTEASIKARLIHMPMTNAILTPESFFKNLGRKHIRFNSTMELMYLHNNYFSPDIEYLQKYLPEINNIVLIRFVSWEAHHDKYHYGIDLNEKKRLINYLKKNNYNIYISSENSLPKEFQKYSIRMPPYMIHHLLSVAKFVVTEGATMASEAVILGTPAIYINPIKNGYYFEQKKYKLIFSAQKNNLIQTINKVDKIVNNKKKMELYRQNLFLYLKNKIDITAFIEWFVLNWPESFRIMKKNQDYQYN